MTTIQLLFKHLSLLREFTDLLIFQLRVLSRTILNQINNFSELLVFLRDSLLNCFNTAFQRLILAQNVVHFGVKLKMFLNYFLYVLQLKLI